MADAVAGPSSDPAGGAGGRRSSPPDGPTSARDPGPVPLVPPGLRAMPPGPRPGLPGPPVHPIRRLIRYWTSRLASWTLVRAWLRPRLEGRRRLPPGPAIYCFNHLGWTDPFVLMGVLPFRPRLYFFGPKEDDMTVGGRNRLLAWTGTTVPYRPGKNDLLDATRRAKAVLDAGGVLAIAGEGRIHVGESALLPLNEGAAYFALRAGVPIVPIAINGTSWLRFGQRVTVRVGEPIVASGRPTREAIDRLTARTWAALHAMVADQPELPVPGPVGRWLTELFNEWPEGRRPGPGSSTG